MESKPIRQSPGGVLVTQAALRIRDEDGVSSSLMTTSSRDLMSCAFFTFRFPERRRTLLHARRHPQSYQWLRFFSAMWSW